MPEANEKEEQIEELKHIRVIDVYEGYPDADLLPINVNETTPVALIENCHDTLFVFLCRELCEEMLTVTTALHRLDTAMRDIQAVRELLQSRFSE